MGQFTPHDVGHSVSTGNTCVACIPTKIRFVAMAKVDVLKQSLKTCLAIPQTVAAVLSWYAMCAECTTLCGDHISVLDLL